MDSPSISRAVALTGLGAILPLASLPAIAEPATSPLSPPPTTRELIFDTFRPLVTVVFASPAVTTSVVVTDSQTSSHIFTATSGLGTTIALPKNNKPLPPPEGYKPRILSISATNNGNTTPIFPLTGVAQGYCFGIMPRPQPTGNGQNVAPAYDAYVLIVAGD